MIDDTGDGDGYQEMGEDDYWREEGDEEEGACPAVASNKNTKKPDAGH